MKVKNHVLICLFVLASNVSIAQEAVLCPLQSDIVKIENQNNIPLVNDNGDDTFTLVFPDQYVTDIFANYIIYDFYQAFPDTSGVLLDYYVIIHGNKDLINDIYQMVPQSVLYIENEYPFLYITNDIINLLDGKIFRVIKTCSNIPETGEYCESTEELVPEGLEINIRFTYDALNDIMNIETADNTSPCGNYFSAGYRGIANHIQLWYSNPGVESNSSTSQPCHSFEEKLYQILGIECSGYNIGDLSVYTQIDTGNLVLERETAIFSSDLVILEESNLSVNENIIENIKPFEIEGNPYLQIASLNNQSIKVEMYNTSGQQIAQARTFEENSFNISNLSTGLYFIRLSNLNNQQKIFKFLKN